MHLTVKLPVLAMPVVNDPDCTDTSYFVKKAFDMFAAKYDKYDVTMDVEVFEKTDY